MSLFHRRRNPEPATPLARLMLDPPDPIDSGRLVRALARSLVHVPMPDEPAAGSPKLVSAGESEGLPLYTVEDHDGVHALVYSTPGRLVAAWGGITAAAVDFKDFLPAWPDGVDLVIDAGHPQAVEVDRRLIHHAALEVAGIPTATSAQPSPDAEYRVPATEPVQLLGVTREVAESVPGIVAMWRAEMLNPEPPRRAVIALVIEVEPGLDAAQRAAVASVLSKAIEQADPAPVLMWLSHPDSPPGAQPVIDTVRALDAPYWKRSS